MLLAVTYSRRILYYIKKYGTLNKFKLFNCSKSAPQNVLYVRQGQLHKVTKFILRSGPLAHACVLLTTHSTNACMEWEETSILFRGNIQASY